MLNCAVPCRAALDQGGARPPHQVCLTQAPQSLRSCSVDKLPSGAALHDELKKATGQRTVPFV